MATAKKKKPKAKATPAVKKKPAVKKRPAAKRKKPAAKKKPAEAVWVPTGRGWGADSAFSQGLGLVRAGKYEEARAMFESAVAAGDETAPKLQLLDVLDVLRDDDAVLALVDDLSGRGKTGRVRVVTSVAISRAEASARLRRGEHGLAEAAARAAIEQKADDAMSYQVLGAALAAREAFAEAHEAMDRVIELEPTWAYGHFMRARYLFDGKRVADAIAAAERVVELEPQDGTSWYNLACYRAVFGDRDAALAALRKAIVLDASNAADARGDDDFAGLATDPEFVALTSH